MAYQIKLWSMVLLMILIVIGSYFVVRPWFFDSTYVFLFPWIGFAEIAACCIGATVSWV